MPSEFRTLPTLAALCAALATSGCARTQLDASIADSFGGADMTSELDFWDQLALQNAVSNRDALHALLLTFELLPESGADDEEKREDGETAPTGDFETELDIAHRRGWIGPETSLVPNETAQVGWIARAMCMEAGIEGGVNMRLFGPIPRYALRELHHQRLLSSKSENQAISGLELLAAIGRIEDRRTGLVSMPRQDF